MPRLLIPLISLLVLAGCGSSSSSSSAPSAGSSSASAASGSGSASSAPSGGAAAGGSTMVTMKNFAFVPAAVHAKVGQTIQFVNQDTAPHNVVGTGGPRFTPSPTLPPGAKFSLRLTHAGTISYICSIHPFMKATIVVAP